MRFLVSETYERWSQADLELGATDDIGFTFTAVEFTLRELIAYIREHQFENMDQPWLSTRFADVDLQSNIKTTSSLHITLLKDVE